MAKVLAIYRTNVTLAVCPVINNNTYNNWDYTAWPTDGFVR